MSFAIETRALSFAFGRRTVVDQVSLHVPEGSIYGFLGPNGAGKTTTIRLLTGMLLSDQDNVFLLGRSLRQTGPNIFTGIGALIESPSLYGHLTGRENLRVIATLRKLPVASVDRALEIVRLHTVQHRKVAQYSLGMKQRLAIAIALLPDPRLLILDEPVNGLDPSGIIEIRELLRHINREEGKTIFVSSHLLAEIEKTCTHIGIIHRGSLKYEGSLEQLHRDAQAHSMVRFTIPGAGGRELPQDWGGVIQGQDEVLFPAGTAEDVARLNEQLVALGIPVTGITNPGGLEDWFMRITQNDKEIR